jgi:hypothetical protein
MTKSNCKISNPAMRFPYRDYQGSGSNTPPESSSAYFLSSLVVVSTIWWCVIYSSICCSNISDVTFFVNKSDLLSADLTKIMVITPSFTRQVYLPKLCSKIFLFLNPILINSFVLVDFNSWLKYLLTLVSLLVDIGYLSDT